MDATTNATVRIRWIRADNFLHSLRAAADLDESLSKAGYAELLSDKSQSDYLLRYRPSRDGSWNGSHTVRLLDVNRKGDALAMITDHGFEVIDAVAQQGSNPGLQPGHMRSS